MTEKEKQEIIDELSKRFLDEKLAKEDVQAVLKNPREKWFRTDTKNPNSIMRQAFDGDGVVAWQVWESIRRLSCKICGKQYVRQLLDVENANYVAEKLCQFIYDLRMEVKDHV